MAHKATDPNQVRRLLAIAAVYDGMNRRDAAAVGGMDRQSLRLGLVTRLFVHLELTKHGGPREDENSPHRSIRSARCSRFREMHL